MFLCAYPRLLLLCYYLTTMALVKLKVQDLVKVENNHILLSSMLVYTTGTLGVCIYSVVLLLLLFITDWKTQKLAKLMSCAASIPADFELTFVGGMIQHKNFFAILVQVSP